MSTQKRKRVDFTLKQKKEIIDAAKDEPNQTELAKIFINKWAFEVKRTTVQSILESKKAIEDAVNAGVPPKRKKLSLPNFPKLDEALLMWLKQARGINLPISGDLTKEKATTLAELLHLPDFKASNGWLDSFKDRHGIKFKTEHGEAGMVDNVALTEWQRMVLKPLISKFMPQDVFNLDETGLFWQLLPNKSMAFRGERCTSGKRAKDRITLLVGANMNGSEKFSLLAIGKSANPRCFKNKEIPMEYKANKNAWMTASIFEEALMKWDQELGQKGRKVLLVLDNCSAHPSDVELDNIHVAFFLPNSTAKSQPMDQGVMQNLKLRYKKVLLRRRIAAMEAGLSFKFDLLAALNLAGEAWNKVTPMTIKNCFAKAQFKEEAIQAEEGDPEIAELWNQVPEDQRMNEDEEIELADLLEADDGLATDGIFTLEEIAEEVMRSEDSDDDDDPELAIEEKVSFVEAQRSAIKVRQYLEQNGSNREAMKACSVIDDAIQSSRQKKMRQPIIQESFAAHQHGHMDNEGSEEA